MDTEECAVWQENAIKIIASPEGPNSRHPKHRGMYVGGVRELKKELQKYRDLFDNAPIGILQPTVDSRLRLQPADVDRMRQPTPFQDRKE